MQEKLEKTMAVTKEHAARKMPKTVDEKIKEGSSLHKCNYMCHFPGHVSLIYSSQHHELYIKYKNL